MADIRIDYDGVEHAATQLGQIAQGVDAGIKGSNAPIDALVAAGVLSDTPAADPLRQIAELTTDVQSSFVAAVSALSEALEKIVRDAQELDQSAATT